MSVSDSVKKSAGRIRKLERDLWLTTGVAVTAYTAETFRKHKDDDNFSRLVESWATEIVALQKMVAESATGTPAAIPGIGDDDYELIMDVYTARDSKRLVRAFFLLMQRLSDDDIDNVEDFNAFIKKNIPKGPYIREALAHAVQYYKTHSTTNSLSPVVEHEVNSLLNAPYFEPEAWGQNAAQLRAVLLKGASDNLPKPIIERLNELNRCLVLGLPMAAISLSRATLEYAIRDVYRGRQKLACMKRDVRSKRVDLIDMIEEACERMGLDHDEVDNIRVWGNDIMHPKAKRRVAGFRVKPALAIRLVATLRHFLELIYRT